MKPMNRDTSAPMEKLLPDLFTCGNPLLNKVAVHSSRSHLDESMTINGSESDKLLVNERDSECHEAVVSDSEVHKANEVSEVRLVGGE